MRPLVSFVFCVEPGRLEPEARLLFRSIRRFGGSLANEPIYAIQPRGAEPLQAETLTVFAESGVVHRASRLNTKFAEWPTTNKVYAVAEVSTIATSEYLAFLDTDSVIVNEPREFLLADGIDIGVQPTVQQFRGSSGPRDPNDPFWLRIYSICGVAEPLYVRTMIDEVTIRGYYNGGLIIFRQSARLAERWVDYLERIGPITDRKARYNLDQFALAAVTASVQGNLRILPPEYNYNIERREDFVSETVRSLDLQQLVHIHYHKAFTRPDFLSLVRPALNAQDERYRWLSQYLPLEGEPPRRRQVSGGWALACKFPRKLIQALVRPA
jgi:hypothetical protein